MKTANLAIVFTDIKGFTERTSRQTLEQNQKMLATHDGLLAPLFKAFGGRVVKNIGDAFLVVFESPTQAVLSGIAIQDRLWQHNRDKSADERLDVRVAINVGEVRLESGDIFGEPVNIAARVEGVADAGEIFFTEAVYLSMNKAEVPSEEVGLFELKGIPGKIRVYKVPHAPYRVEPATTGPVLPERSRGADEPPYGNLGLSKVGDAAFSDKALAATHDMSVKAVALGSKAADEGAKLLRQAPGMISKIPRPAYAVAAGALIIGLLYVLIRSPIEGAIADVRDTPKTQRSAKVSVAKELISKEKNAGKRAWYLGRLAEAEEEFGTAVNRYADGIREDNSDSKKALIKLINHGKCSVRESATNTAVALKLKDARGAIEDLADDGGADDGEKTLWGLAGCNSKETAKAALERLK